MTDEIPVVQLPKHILARPGGAGVSPIEAERPWKQLAVLPALAPRLDGAEACCGHCTRLSWQGQPVDAPTPSILHPGFMHLSTLYGCALQEGTVLADNVCQQFVRRA